MPLPKAKRDEHMNKLFLSTAFFLAICAVSPLFANVSVKNGNFFVSYTDIDYPGGFEPKIDRVYNSKSNFKGIFGWGWGMESEVYLEIHPEGVIIAHEYGSGASNVFVPSNAKPLDLTSAADKIVAAARQNLDIASPSAIQSYRDRLMSDIDFRSAEWNKYLRLGLVKPANISIGAQLISDQFSHQIVVRTPMGYERAFDSGRKESFDDRGRLTRILDANGNYVQFGYGVRNRIQIVDNYGRHISIFLNDHKLVERVEGDDGVASTYAYDDHDNLIYNKDTDNNVFRYDYDDRHNLKKISYGDATTQEISYYPLERHENVRSVKDRDGVVTNYDYWSDPGDSGHSRVTVDVKDAARQPISNKSYEYFEKRTPDGVTYTARLIQNIDGTIEDTTYGENGLPISIAHGNEKTAFQYDSSGHMTRKETSTEITQLEYDPVVNKISYVRNRSKVDPKDTTWARYRYDDKGNLIEATNDAGLTARLNYDGLGRISEMTRKDGASLMFSYNRISKPVEICTVEGKKKDCIEVTYTDSGQIAKVDSPSGREVARKVTSSFQELVDLIRPAGLSLSF